LHHSSWFGCDLLRPELKAGCICCHITAHSNDLDIDS
jgi:hypothetical protein